DFLTKFLRENSERLQLSRRRRRDKVPRPEAPDERCSCVVRRLCPRGMDVRARRRAAASVEIHVVDPDHAAVVGAPVVLLHVPSNDQRTDVTGASGTSQFEGLAPGEYRIEISAPGFTLHTQSLMLAASRRTIEALLDVAPFSENVTVEGVATVPTIGRIKVPLRDQPLTVNTLSSEFIETH